jgi:hypothetical protein
LNQWRSTLHAASNDGKNPKALRGKMDFFLGIFHIALYLDISELGRSSQLFRFLQFHLGSGLARYSGIRERYAI